jgi:hypothetical protein
MLESSAWQAMNEQQLDSTAKTMFNVDRRQTSQNSED